MRVSNLIKKPKRDFLDLLDIMMKNCGISFKEKFLFKNYYEVGCPSWGLLRMAKNLEKIYFFLKK